MPSENPYFYNLARKICHQNGFDFSDPRTGDKYPAAKSKMIKKKKKKSKKKVRKSN